MSELQRNRFAIRPVTNIAEPEVDIDEVFNALDDSITGKEGKGSTYLANIKHGISQLLTDYGYPVVDVVKMTPSCIDKKGKIKRRTFERVIDFIKNPKSPPNKWETD